MLRSSARWNGQQLEPEKYRLLARRRELKPFRITDGETDMLLFGTDVFFEEAARFIHEAREQVGKYIGEHPSFQKSLVPVPDDDDAPPVVRDMIRAGKKAEVGPMAAVAGAVAQYTGRRLLGLSPEIAAENGGDVFFRTDHPRRFGIVAESAGNPLVHIEVAETVPGAGKGVCTSSGRLGHSMNFGRADAVTVIAEDAALADALATAASNRIQSRKNIRPTMEWTLERGAEGIVIMAFEQIAAMGSVHFSG